MRIPLLNRSLTILGIGVSYVSLEDQGSSGALQFPLYEEGKCAGVQCPETWRSPFTYNEHMPNGEYSIRLSAKDEVGYGAAATAVVRVDGEAPYAIKLSGLPPGGQISELVHKIKVRSARWGVPDAELWHRFAEVGD